MIHVVRHEERCQSDDFSNSVLRKKSVKSLTYVINVGSHEKHGQMEEAETGGRDLGKGLQVLFTRVGLWDQPLCNRKSHFKRILQQFSSNTFWFLLQKAMPSNRYK
jgi:hypothetical protein